MIELTKSEIDDSEFIFIAQKLTNEIIQDSNPKEFYLFKIDNWFDKKWLNFTGKVLGALGIWNYQDNTRIPPFSPNRILEQGYYKQDDFGNYKEKESELIIHKKQPAEHNFQRRIINVSKSALFIWYSSNTEANAHGSFMVYPVENDKCEPFYVGFKKNKKWDIVNAPGTNRKMIEFYLEKDEKLSNNS